MTLLCHEDARQGMVFALDVCLARNGQHRDRQTGDARRAVREDLVRVVGSGQMLQAERGQSEFPSSWGRQQSWATRMQLFTSHMNDDEV